MMKFAPILIAGLLAMTLPASARTTVTVTHGKTPNPTYLDLGSPGESVGDQRIWEFSGKTTDNVDVVMDWTMVTTGEPAKGPGLESRMTNAVFSFGATMTDPSTDDRIMIAGIGLYPTKGSTVKVNSTLDRAIIGGTGKYAGAKGIMQTTHQEDGTWRHVLSIE